MITATSRRNGNRKVTTKLRVAIYCRISVDDGKDQELTSVALQRQLVESYVHSQRGEGWIALPTEYNDSGFSGGNVERPAFQKLLQDIEAGRVDAVATYRLDRLSRSLADFVKINEFLEKHGVSYVSVTQNFNSASSMGRLVLNILMSFAEFEREMISERTRDKMGATRRKGMWCGGTPVLGYDVIAKKLVVNEEEAERVREIFQLFADLGSAVGTVEELNSRGWRTKSGAQWNKDGLSRILKNPTYLGKVRYDGEIYDGAHEAIVDQELWDAVQARLKTSPRDTASRSRCRSGALLAGLLRCGACGAAMSPHHSKRGSRQYRYYCCQTAQKRGAAACPDSRVQAAELERFVVNRIKAIGKDPQVFRATLQATRKAVQARQAEITQELKSLERESKKLAKERKNLLDAVSGGSGTQAVLGRLQEVEEAIQEASTKQEELRSELTSLETQTIDEKDLRTALGEFTPVWNELFPAERARVMRLLIEKVSYHAKDAEVELTFRPTGIRTLAKK